MSFTIKVSPLNKDPYWAHLSGDLPRSWAFSHDEQGDILLGKFLMRNTTCIRRERGEGSDIYFNKEVVWSSGMRETIVDGTKYQVVFFNEYLPGDEFPKKPIQQKILDTLNLHWNQNISSIEAARRIDLIYKEHE